MPSPPLLRCRAKATAAAALTPPLPAPRCPVRALPLRSPRRGHRRAATANAASLPPMRCHANATTAAAALPAAVACSLAYLIVACIHNRFDGRSFSSVNASQTFSWVIVVAVTIVAVVTVVAARVSTPPAMAVASTAASVIVVFVFAPALPPVAAVLRRRPVTLAS
jgi:hypothetical protein